MGIIKGLLGADKAELDDDEGDLPSPFAAAEAAVDSAIRERRNSSVNATGFAPGLSTNGETVAYNGPDRRTADGQRPGDLPERRSGTDRRLGIERRGPVAREFGRRK